MVTFLRAAKVYAPISKLVHAHIGRAAVVIGGGMSAPNQLDSVNPKDAVYLSVNQHGVVLRMCDYLVCIDDVLKRDLPVGDGATKRVHDFGVPVISTRRWADYRIFEQPAHNSGVVACWAAWLMGCAPIIPIGMDMYKGGVYFHTPSAKSSGTYQHYEHHVQKWEKFKRECPHAVVRAIGGPLLDLFPRYTPNESMPPALPRAQLLEACAGKVVTLKKRLDFAGTPIAAGEQELSAAEVRHAQRMRAM